MLVDIFHTYCIIEMYVKVRQSGALRANGESPPVKLQGGYNNLGIQMGTLIPKKISGASPRIIHISPTDALPTLR